jgi:uncharacterized protein YecT (DUF1311 family)
MSPMIPHMRVHTASTLTGIILWSISCGTGTAQHMNAPDAPCRSAGSGYETAVCFDKAAKKDDLDLNRFYGELQQKLQEGDQEKLRIAQRLWLQFRDATCAAERQLYTTGSAAPTVYSACLEAQTRQRTKDLHTTYDWLLSK